MECDDVYKCTEDIRDLLTSILNRLVTRTGQALVSTVQMVWLSAGGAFCPGVPLVLLVRVVLVVGMLRQVVVVLPTHEVALAVLGRGGTRT